jgi:ABC-2 type transport system ATP-binding protein
MTAVLQVDGLSKSYGKVKAITDFNLTVDAGQIHGLIGPNGAGKSSTVACILGLIKPDQGTIRINGIPTDRHFEQLKGAIGALLQPMELPAQVTPQEALRWMGSFYREHASAEELLRQFGLEAKANTRYHHLSAGQKQRLGLAIALVGNPKLLVLDEPATGLDPLARSELLELLEQIRGNGVAVLMSTHHLEDAERICDQITLIDMGKLVTSGTSQAVIARADPPAYIRLHCSPPLHISNLLTLPEASDAGQIGDAISIKTRNPDACLLSLMPLLVQKGHVLRSLDIQRPGLREAFVFWTGRSWPDAQALDPQHEDLSK